MMPKLKAIGLNPPQIGKCKNILFCDAREFNGSICIFSHQGVGGWYNVIQLTKFSLRYQKVKERIRYKSSNSKWCLWVWKNTQACSLHLKVEVVVSTAFCIVFMSFVKYKRPSSRKYR